MSDSLRTSLLAGGLGMLFMHAQVYSLRMMLFLRYIFFFHFMEFVSTALFNPTRVSADSFLIPHSNSYTMVFIFSLLEYNFSFYTEKSQILFILGIIVTTGGQFMRTYAMYSAKQSFNHKVQLAKAEDHVLITNGAYKLCRHPSYFGFYWWSIGTQFILGNYIGLLIHIVMLTAFFKSRVKVEEAYLVEFFGNDYVEYKKNVKTWIPLV